MTILDDPATLVASAVPVHHTATDDGAWDAGKQVSNLGDEPTAAQLRACFAWKPDDADDAASKSNWKFPHHFVDADGSVGAASTKGCSAGIAVLNGGRGGADIPDGQRQGVYNHLKAHLVDSGVDPDDVPKLMAAAVRDAFAEAQAEPVEEPAEEAAEEPAVEMAAVTVLPSFGLSCFIAAATLPSADPTPFETLGARWSIREETTDDERTFAVLAADGSVRWNVTSREQAMARIAEELAVELTVEPDRPVLATTWRSEMAFEGVSTGDGRKIAPGAVEFRDCPMPLMLQTATEDGHYGAVLAGAILQTGTVGNVAVGTGVYDDSEAGRQFAQIVEARGRFGVSIDVAEAEGEPVCYEQNPETGECLDGEMVFSLVRVMGLTGTPFPAFENAYIENVENSIENVENSQSVPADRTEPVAAAAVPECGCDETTVVPCDACTSVLLVAAGIDAPVAPPAEWFENPRLDRPTPPTVTPEGRVYGHVAPWKGCHTSYSDRCVPPPRSRSGYAYFTTGAVTCADGTTVRVGQITMSCGHADDSPTLGYRRAKAHYDGGPGAVQVADVAVGEDAHGIWFSGALRPGVTEEQVREFQAQQLSGDWRSVGRGSGLELVAALVVPVPGFPIAASADPEPAPAVSLGTVRYVEGEPVVLIAAGVRRRASWEIAVERLEGEVADLRARLDRSERVTEPLRPLAAARLLAAATAVDD